MIIYIIRYIQRIYHHIFRSVKKIYTFSLFRESHKTYSNIFVCVNTHTNYIAYILYKSYCGFCLLTLGDADNK